MKKIFLIFYCFFTTFLYTQQNSEQNHSFFSWQSAQYHFAESGKWFGIGLALFALPQALDKGLDYITPKKSQQSVTNIKIVSNNLCGVLGAIAIIKGVHYHLWAAIISATGAGIKQALNFNSPANHKESEIPAKI